MHRADRASARYAGDYDTEPAGRQGGGRGVPGASGGDGRRGPCTWSAAGLPVAWGRIRRPAISRNTGDYRNIDGDGNGDDSRGASAQAVYTIVIGTPASFDIDAFRATQRDRGNVIEATIGVVGSGGPFTFAVTAGRSPDGVLCTSRMA